MHKEDIKSDLKNLAFDFFYWFSRFEFSLKENNFLKRDDNGENAEPGWDKFVDQNSPKFHHTEQTRRLLELNPKRQKVGPNCALQWKNVGLEDCKSELCKVVRLLRTIRNNLFHGGKHGADGWDDPQRTKELLLVGKSVLDQLAYAANFEGDYNCFY